MGGGHDHHLPGPDQDVVITEDFWWRHYEDIVIRGIWWSSNLKTSVSDGRKTCKEAITVSLTELKPGGKTETHKVSGGLHSAQEAQ